MILPFQNIVWILYRNWFISLGIANQIHLEVIIQVMNLARKLGALWHDTSIVIRLQLIQGHHHERRLCTNLSFIWYKLSSLKWSMVFHCRKENSRSHCKYKTMNLSFFKHTSDRRLLNCTSLGPSKNYVTPLGGKELGKKMKKCNIGAEI